MRRKPGTDTKFPAQFAGNWLSVPGLALRETLRLSVSPEPLGTLPLVQHRYDVAEGEVPCGGGLVRGRTPTPLSQPVLPRDRRHRRRRRARILLSLPGRDDEASPRRLH